MWVLAEPSRAAFAETPSSTKLTPEPATLVLVIAIALTFRGRQAACRAPRQNQALEGRSFCHTRGWAFSQLRPTNYDACAKGSRFLQVDPVEGGSCNDYDYVCGDSINAFDLDGEVCWSCHWKKAKKVYKKAKKVIRGVAKNKIVRKVIVRGATAVAGVGIVADIWDASKGRWRQVVVGYVAGAAVGATCGMTVVVATGGIGAVGLGGCAILGAAAGEFMASKVNTQGRR